MTDRMTVFTSLSFEKLRLADADVTGAVSSNLKHRLVNGNNVLLWDFRYTRVSRTV